MIDLRAVAERARTVPAAWPLVGWAALVTITAVWGGTLPEEVHLEGPPLIGAWDVVVSSRLLPALLLAGGVVVWGPSLLARLPWRAALATAAALAVAWTILLAHADGPGRITEPFGTHYEYVRAVPLVESPAAWLDGDYLTLIDDLPTHVKSHPPGGVLALWTLDRLGWGGTGSAAALAITGVAAAVAAVAVATREVAGEPAARRALPFLALAPAWVFASSLDALYAGAGAIGVALIVLATGTGARHRDALALGGGVGLGVGLFLSYGLVLIAGPVVAVALHRRALRPLLLAAIGTLAVVVLVATAGFWWFDGLAATRREYEEGLARLRPFGYFVVGNLGAFALAVGPVIAVALARLRDRSVWVLVGGVLVAVAVADLSGLSKGAVERIWLPFAVWLPVAAIALWDRTRWWLAAHAGAGLALQAAVRAPW